MNAILSAVKANPADELVWLALADWLEEHDQPGPAELHRLGVQLRRPEEGAGPSPGRAAQEARLIELLASGVRPVVPTETVALAAGGEMTFALIPPGTFWMGSPDEEARRGEDEGPRRQVTLTRPFYLGITQVTQRQWLGQRPNNPSAWVGADRPVETVSWTDSCEFCASLGRFKGRRFRLPTEAEWEYACRAGTTTAFHFGAALSTDQANFDGLNPSGNGPAGSFRKETVPVGSFPPNAFGIHDMHGNLSDRCQDRYSADYYHKARATDPPGPTRGQGRVVRGGSWNGYPHWCRSAYRGWDHESTAGLYVGFRVVLDAPRVTAPGKRAGKRGNRSSGPADASHS